MINGSRKIYIWGTGNNAHILMNRIAVYFHAGRNAVSVLWDEKVIGFIDGDASKQGGLFKGKPVVAPKNAIDEMDFCIITVADNAGIIDILSNNGFKEECYCTWEDFVTYCRDVILGCRETILNDRKNDISTRLYRYLSNSKFFEQIDSNGAGDVPDDLFEADNAVSVTASLEWLCGDDIGKANSIARTISLRKDRQGSVSTIGLFVERFYAGGIERMVSILCGLLCERGYKVILITEEEHPDKDYPVHKKATRYNMKYRHTDALEERLLEFQKTVKDFNIDIMCYHAGYARLDTFYELLFFKLINIPTTIEIHSAVKALVSDQPVLSSKYPIIYQMADRVVTISKADRDYWEGKGCHCVMIPNPVGDFGIYEKTPRHQDDGFKRVIWVGRIVQNPKRVLDTVQIMNNVNKTDNKIKLVIVGARDNPKIYGELKKSIDELGLNNCIEIRDYQKDISGLYKDADVLLMTSSSECYPNVVIEAKMYSRPIVMYEIPWLELTKDGKGIISVEQLDVEAAADALIKLLNDDALWEKLSSEAWESALALKNYDPVADWTSLFESIRQCEG